MRARRIAVIAATGALVAGGAGGAIAAVSDDDASKAEQAVLDDAAKRLDVTPQRLRDALAAAQDAQLDEAVEDGKLTRAQADAIKQRRARSGRVLGGPGGPGLRLHGPGGPRRGPGLALRGDIATALGITEAQLHEQLHDGKTIADIAKAEGRSLASVRTAVASAARTRADKAVADGDLTRAQADRMLARLDRALENLDRPLMLKHRRGHRGPPPLAPPGSSRPGSFRPGGGEAPALDPAGGVFS